MAELHDAGGWIAVGVTACFTLAALAFAWFIEPRQWLESLRKGVTVALAVQVMLGVLTYAGGFRPKESLHVVYGVVALLVLPAAGAFASEAPPRARSGTLGLGGAVTLVVLWRLFATG